ncbi:transposase [Mycolicibacterium conceptionense]|uniref:Transposase n=1 Tax=Mycolicibacterium conceptionense TaxID=451644 RepID=A0A0U1D4I7_9MYCO|nr:transposase [Mycolicibacterium conceptionense]
MRTELVEDALKAAVTLRGSLTGAAFYTDHGSDYTSQDFAKLRKDLGEIDDDDIEDADQPSAESCPDPGLTPRILEIAERARTTRRGIDSLAHD